MLSGMSAKGRCHFQKVKIELILDSGEVQNFVGIHPTPETVEGVQSGNSAEVKDSMIQEYRHFHPDVVKIFQFGLSSASAINLTDRSTAQQRKSKAGRSSSTIPCQIGHLEKCC